MALPSDPQTPRQAADLIRAGKLCAIPTETVYGLAGDAANSDAVLSIYETKGRPRFNPLICHCADVAMAETLAVFDARAEMLAERFWPGPLTLVLPLRDGARISDLVTAGLGTVALRIPDHPLARAVIEAVGRPLAAPSANPSGQLSPTTAEHVRQAFGGAVPVLDGGPCIAGVESTIVALEEGGAVLLRPGALPAEEIEAVLGQALDRATPGAAIAAPGMMASHYAPRALLRLDAEAAQPGEAWLGFGPDSGEGLNLSPKGDLREAARNLFGYLARLDAQGAARIAVAPIPETGLGEAINDRLRRAAAPR